MFSFVGCRWQSYEENLIPSNKIVTNKVGLKANIVKNPKNKKTLKC